MAKAPAFQFYANDFMDSTRFMEANAVGLYVRCLCIQWTLGSIPADLKILARAIHCDRSELESVWSVLSEKFVAQGDGTLKNRRLEEVRDRQSEVSAKRSDAGKAGAIAKANAKANEPTKDKQRKVKEKEKVEREDEGEAFNTWWELYERKGSRKLSAEQWARLTPEDQAACIANTPAYVRSKPDKVYRKDGERFLRNRTWEDEILNASPVMTTNGSGMTKAQADEEMRQIRIKYGRDPENGWVGDEECSRPLLIYMGRIKERKAV